MRYRNNRKKVLSVQLYYRCFQIPVTLITNRSRQSNNANKLLMNTLKSYASYVSNFASYVSNSFTCIITFLSPTDSLFSRLDSQSVNPRYQPHLAYTSFAHVGYSRRSTLLLSEIFIVRARRIGY